MIPPPQNVLPGGKVHWECGSLLITGIVGRRRANITVTVTLADQIIVSEKRLRVLSPTVTLPFDDEDAHGVLTLKPTVAPHFSSLDADLAIKSKGMQPCSFKGSVARWQWNQEVIFVSRRHDLAPTLLTVTQVKGTPDQAVNVILKSGKKTLYTLSMNQRDPKKRIPDRIDYGDIHIKAGARFHLTIATPQQRGQVFMQACYRIQPQPETLFSAAIATWPYFPVDHSGKIDKTTNEENHEHQQRPEV